MKRMVCYRGSDYVMIRGDYGAIASGESFELVLEHFQGEKRGQKEHLGTFTPRWEDPGAPGFVFGFLDGDRFARVSRAGETSVCLYVEG